MAASLVRFVRGGLGRSFNSKLIRNQLMFLQIVRCSDALHVESIFTPPKTTASHFQPSNVSGLTFELALANANVSLHRVE